MLHGEMLAPGGPHPAALRLHLHDRQRTALLPGREGTGELRSYLRGGLDDGGSHRRGPLCEYKPTICIQIQKNLVRGSYRFKPAEVFFFFSPPDKV